MEFSWRKLGLGGVKLGSQWRKLGPSDVRGVRVTKHLAGSSEIGLAALKFVTGMENAARLTWSGMRETWLSSSSYSDKKRTKINARNFVLLIEKKFYHTWKGKPKLTWYFTQHDMEQLTGVRMGHSQRRGGWVESVQCLCGTRTCHTKSESHASTLKLETGLKCEVDQLDSVCQYDVRLNKVRWRETRPYEREIGS